MFRILNEGVGLPHQWPVSPDAVFKAGSAAMLTVAGNQICVKPSDGTGFIGIFDDVRTRSFSAVSWDENVIVSVPPANITTNGSGQLITITEMRTELQNPNVDANSFVSLDLPVALIPRNGVISFPPSSVLNLDLTGSGSQNALKTRVRYSYTVPNILGDDSTIGSSMASVWINRLLFSTDQFEVNQQYMVNSNLFINESGLFTTRQIHPNFPAVCIVTAPPNPLFPNLEALML